MYLLVKYSVGPVGFVELKAVECLCLLLSILLGALGLLN